MLTKGVGRSSSSVWANNFDTHIRGFKNVASQRDVDPPNPQIKVSYTDFTLQVIIGYKLMYSS